MKLKDKRVLLYFCFIAVFTLGCFRQVLDSDRENRDIRIVNPYRGTVTIPIEIINNLVVIPIRINNSNTLKFVLDTGASRTIITELGPNQGFIIDYQDDIILNGLGNSGSISAIVSKGNNIYSKGIEGENHTVVLLLEGVFNLSNFMGTQVNGLLGYDIFENFIVEVNYQRERLYFHDPDTYKKEYEAKKKNKDWNYIPLEIDNNKLYMNVGISQNDGSKIQAKLIIDSGASHTIFLYSETSEEIVIPSNTVYSFLGMGLSGEIYGDIGRVKQIEVSGVELNNPVISYPKLDDIKNAVNVAERNGSIGADFLRRFNVIFNYSEPSMLIKPNNNFDDDFTYNTSGMEITTPFVDIPFYVVTKIRPGSPADVAGVQKNDVIFKINYRRVYELSLSEILDIFHSSKSKKIRLDVRRDDEIKRINLQLKDITKLDNDS